MEAGQRSDSPAEGEGTCGKGGLCVHCRIPPRLKSHLGSSWQVPFQPWLRFQVTMEIYRRGKSGLINAEVISRLAWGAHKS